MTELEAVESALPVGFSPTVTEPEAVARLLPATQWAVGSFDEHAWMHVADYLAGLLRRAPVLNSPGWTAERTILGCLAMELRQEAIAHGFPATDPTSEPLWIEGQKWPDERSRIGGWRDDS